MNICQYRPMDKGTCSRPSKYMIGWEHNGAVAWIPVCGYHDHLIGLRNLQRAFGLSWQEARKMNTEMCEKEA